MEEKNHVGSFAGFAGWAGEAGVGEGGWTCTAGGAGVATTARGTRIIGNYDNMDTTGSSTFNATLKYIKIGPGIFIVLLLWTLSPSSLKDLNCFTFDKRIHSSIVACSTGSCLGMRYENDRYCVCSVETCCIYMCS